MKTIYILLLSAIMTSIGSTAYGQSTNQNYIRTRTYTNESGTTYLDQVQYFDGLGRPVQTVQKAITSGTDPSVRKDLVILQEYDAFGRESNAWLPAAIAGNNGAYVTPATVKTQAVATNCGDQKPYSMPVYEASPLNRVLKQFGPGQDWQNNGKAVTTGYLTNLYKAAGTLVIGDSLVCALYKTTDDRKTISISRSDSYNTGELYVTRLKDEDDNTSYEFKDKLGQVILTRQINEGKLYDTNYIYDSFGNLRVVIPPVLSDMVLGNTTWTDSNADFGRYAYLYKYDNFNRCIWKKLPGCEPIYYVYDKADHLIFTQDGEQRKTDEWTFNKYDVFGRVVITGLHTMAGKTHDQLRTLVESQLVTEKYLLNSHWSYTWNSLTSLLTSTNYKQVLQVNYYDNYEFRKRPEYIASKFNFTNAGTEYNKRYGTDAGVIEQKGQLTATATARLDGQNKFDYSVLYYDDRKQLIQIKNTNHLDGTEEEYIAYNFTGQPEKKLHIHTKDAQGNGRQEELYTYTYDHAGRLLSTKHKLNTGAEVTLAENSYDELGRLKANKKNNQTNLNTTYAYNVRSWTSNITNTHFNEALTYSYNGNISSMQWGQAGKTRKYSFTYDNLSRLKGATYTGDGNFNTAYSYDKHGNMMTMQRYGLTAAATYGIIDNLTMTYTGNQMKTVNDAVADIALNTSMDFKNYSNVATEYTYNKNGAMTQDLNKGISSISYNSLNLLRMVDIKNKTTEGRNEYTYSASGQKLKAVQRWNPNYSTTPVIGSTINTAALTQSQTTDYVGNIIYENNTLKRILVDGGYYESGNYYFYVTDHLGNNRIVTNAAASVVQSTQYYPFGSSFADATVANAQPYKYNGKELDARNGLNMYDYSARWKDDFRFTTVDPLAEKYYSISPYAYVMDNPLKFIDPTGREIYYAADGTRLGKVGENDDIRVINSGISNEDAMQYIQSGSEESIGLLMDGSIAFIDYFTPVSDVTNDAALVLYSGNCYTAAAKQLRNAGYAPLGRASAIDTKTDKGYSPELNPDPIGGAIRIQTELYDGKPVIVGVEQTDDRGYFALEKGNANKSTGHFIVIRSTSLNEEGVVSFNYLDNASYSGKSQNNNLTLNLKTGVIKGRMSARGLNYTVSEVRSSKPIKNK